MNIRIMLVDNQEIILDGLRVLLEKETGFRVIATARDGWEAIQSVHKNLPDIIIMDINMPNLNGIEATLRIKAQYPSIKILSLSINANSSLIARMIEAGASGCLSKRCASTELIEAIRTVVQNRTYLSPNIWDSVFQYFQDKTQRAFQPNALLTQREREVLQLIAEGKSTKEISSYLHISYSTADTHRQSIMNKLGLHNVAVLTKYSIEHGITTLDY